MVRAGDVRFVFGLFKDGAGVAPAVLGLYPKLDHPSARAQIYRSPVGEVRFAHAGAVPGVRTGHALDADGKGFVIAAAIPRAAIPAMTRPFGADVRTQLNFDANLGGNHKFWWANQDGSANIETLDEGAAAFPIVQTSRDAKLDTVMSNSFGFGGTNASLVFGRV